MVIGYDDDTLRMTVCDHCFYEEHNVPEKRAMRSNGAECTTCGEGTSWMVSDVICVRLAEGLIQKTFRYSTAKCIVDPCLPC